MAKRRTPQETKAAFRAIVSEQGGKVVGVYVNNKTKTLIECAEGHVVPVRPDSVLHGQGVCSECARITRQATFTALRAEDSQRSRGEFYAAITAQGGTVHGDYVNNRTPVLIECVKGHVVPIYPDRVQQGRGICGECGKIAGQATLAAYLAEKSERAGEEFYFTVTARGGTVHGEYKNRSTPALIECANGHRVKVRPMNVQQGQGICHECAGMVWDVFYAVVNRAQNRVKFGISSGDSRPRLRRHRRAGYTDVIFCAENLPDGLAKATEDAVKSALKDAGYKPLHGREYFDISALGLIMDVVEGHLGEAEAA